jgi:hypothetical protein
MEEDMGIDGDDIVPEPAIDDVGDEPWASADDAELEIAPPELSGFEGGPDGELGEAPPLPPGIDPTGGGQSVIGGPPAPVVDLGDGGDAAGPRGPGGMEGADFTTPPPVPDGLDSAGDSGSHSVIGSGQPGSDTSTDGPRGPGGMEGADFTTPPPSGVTGEQGNPPPVPDGLDSAGDTGSHSVMGSGQPGSEPAPATLSNEAATQLLSGLLPGMLAEDVEVAIMGAADDGTIDVKEIINLLHAHGYEPASEPATSVTEVVASSDHVQLVGSVDGALVPLTVDSVDTDRGMLVCTDPGGSAFEARVEDVDRAWRSSGTPLLRNAGAAPSGDTTPVLTSTPAVAVTGEEASGLAGALGVGAAAFIPVALGGGVLARRLARRR